MCALNLNGDEKTTALIKLTNHPGADLEYFIGGEIIGFVKVKAVQDPAAIIEHFSRYPDIDVLTTSEVTDLLSGMFGKRLRDSTFQNEDVTRMTRDTFEENIGPDLGEFVQDGLMSSALNAGALQARALLTVPRVSPEQMRSHLEIAGTGIGTAVTVDALISMLCCTADLDSARIEVTPIKTADKYFGSSPVDGNYVSIKTIEDCVDFLPVIV